MYMYNCECICIYKYTDNSNNNTMRYIMRTVFNIHWTVAIFFKENLTRCRSGDSVIYVKVVFFQGIFLSAKLESYVLIFSLREGKIFHPSWKILNSCRNNHISTNKSKNTNMFLPKSCFVFFISDLFYFYFYFLNLYSRNNKKRNDREILTLL